VQSYVANGTITADQAAGVSFALNQSYSLNTSAVSDFAYALEAETIITQAEATELISEYDAYMFTDLENTLALLH